MEKGLPVIVPGIKYLKTAKKITQFSSPVKATTYTAGMLLEICGGKQTKYAVLCTVWMTTSTLGFLTGNPALIGVGIEAGREILEDFYG